MILTYLTLEEARKWAAVDAGFHLQSTAGEVYIADHGESVRFDTIPRQGPVQSITVFEDCVVFQSSEYEGYVISVFRDSMVVEEPRVALYLASCCGFLIKRISNDLWRIPYEGHLMLYLAAHLTKSEWSAYHRKNIIEYLDRAGIPYVIQDGVPLFMDF